MTRELQFIVNYSKHIYKSSNVTCEKLKFNYCLPENGFYIFQKARNFRNSTIFKKTLMYCHKVTNGFRRTLRTI